MFRIGEFSQIARVSGRLLRYYDEIGLLTPQSIDLETGYRYYSARQLPRLNRILVLKELGLSLEHISRLLDQETSVEEIRGMLTLRKAQIEQTLHEEGERLRIIEARLQKIDTQVQMQEPDVILKAVPATPFLGLREVLPGQNAIQRLVRRLAMTVPARIGRHSLGHIAILIHSPLYDPDALDVEVGYLLVGKGPQSLELSEEEVLTLRTLPAVETMATLVHVGRVIDSHRGSGALATWMEQHGWQMSGTGRELLLQLPQSQEQNEAVAEIQLPVTRCAHFARQRLQAGRATALSQPQAISGLGGIGKTQLALEYAYRYHQDYQVVLWAHAESREALISSYVAIASLLQLSERDAKMQEIIVQAVETWLQTHQNWLLILDNADELAILPDLLPPVLGGHLLLTTRATATGRLAHRLEMETLSPEQGALLLLRRASLIAPDENLSQASQEELELALCISQGLGGLPLALDQAGAYLEETGTDLTSYWQMYQQHRVDLLRQRGGLVADHPEPVATTWSISFQKITEKNPVSSDLLRLCVYLAPDAIAEEIVMAGAPFLGPILQPIAGK